MKGYLKILLVVALALSGETVMAKVNTETLSAKIKSLEGISADDKSALLELLSERKKYGLVWEVKTEAVEEKMREEFPIFTEVKDRAIVSEDAEAPNHILIEGDNLHALTCLSYTHSNKVDVIYIDPPYNTGNKDFVYNDSYVDKEDSFRHSKWLSFMEKRLKIAKGLLSDKGVIFISIDDNEQAQLKLLCDEIFGEKNHLATIHWRKNRKPHNAGNTMSVSYEFLHVYYKHIPVKLVQDYAEMFEDEKGKYAEYPILKADKRIRTYTFLKGITCRGVFHKGRTTSAKNDKCNVDILDEPIILNGILQNDIRVSGRFCLTDEKGKLSAAMKSDNIFFTKSGIPKEKRYRTDKDSKIDTNWWDLQNGKNEDGDDELINIFNLPNENTIFDHPKPIKLVQRILTDYGNKNIVVLDFFAGSGTTGHAVMLQNEEDGGKRTCILVTNNENGICEKVTYERNKRVIQGYTTPKGEVVAGLSANTLRYYKTEFVARRPTVRNRRALMAAAVDLLCVKNDVYQESKIFFGKKLKAGIARYFDNGHGTRMLVVFDDAAVQSVATAIAAAEFDGVVKVYVFSHGDYAYNEEFQEVAEKVELCALPAAIENAYRRVMGKYAPVDSADDAEDKD